MSLEIIRDIEKPLDAVKRLTNDPCLVVALDDHISAKDISFGNFNTVYNPRMVIALRKGQTTRGSIEIYCMGGVVYELEADKDYSPVPWVTYSDNGDDIDSIMKEIQKKRVHPAKNFMEQVYGSYFYGMNPLCGKTEDLFLIDVEAEFTESGQKEKPRIDYVFLSYANDVPNLLFIECKRASNKDNKRKKGVSDTYMQLLGYKHLIDKQRFSLIKQYNHVIDFYNLLEKERKQGVLLKKLDEEKSQIGLGLVVFYQQPFEDNKDEETIANSVLTEVGTVSYLLNDPHKERFPGCGIPFYRLGKNRATEELDEEFEERTIHSINDLARKIFHSTKN